LILIRIQGFDDQKLGKIYSRQKKILGSKTTIYLSLGLQKGSPSYRKSPSTLKKEHPALHKT
jgi:hypothetical protein